MTDAGSQPHAASHARKVGIENHRIEARDSERVGNAGGILLDQGLVTLSPDRLGQGSGQHLALARN